MSDSRMDAEFPLSDHVMIKIDGTAVRRLRETKGLTQLYVATVVGVTTDTISRWENKRYQTIKRGNGLKLAEALETQLDDILDHPDAAPEKINEPVDISTAATSSAPSPSTSPTATTNTAATTTKRAGKIWGIVVVGVLLAAAAGIWHVTSEQMPTSVIATRRLPSTSPPGQIFPVVIDIVSPDENGDVSLIIQEQLPAGVVPIKSSPAYTTYDSKNGILKWLQKTEGQRLTIIYLARMSSNSRQKELIFDGKITSKGRKPAPFSGGASSMETAPFHWADLNRDHAISDEEILGANDAFGGVEGIGSDFTLLEAIWSGGGYTWDEEKKRYVVLPE